MAPVDPAGQLAALLREEMARPGRKGLAPRGAAARGDGARQKLDLQTLLAPRLRAIAQDDPARRRKVLRAFLEATFLKELGPQLANETGFNTMVSGVVDQMEADQRLAPSIDELVQVLTAEDRPSN